MFSIRKHQLSVLVTWYSSYLGVIYIFREFNESQFRENNLSKGEREWLTKLASNKDIIIQKTGLPLFWRTWRTWRVREK